MFDNKKILAVIPARGGSKGIPRKNIKNLAGIPLIGWTINAALKSKYIDYTVLSSEDDEIINLAIKLGCSVPFKRPEELAKDDTHGILPILHAIDNCKGFDYVIMLQPTSPLRTTEDIDEFIEFSFERNALACVSVSETAKSPYWMFSIKNEYLNPLLPEFSLVPRRQDLPKTYALNGALYLAKIEWLQENRNFVSLETKAYVMPNERSFDIDTELDFLICEMLLSKNFFEK